MPCQSCGLPRTAFIHLRESTGYHVYAERESMVSMPTYMDMEDAVREMDKSNLSQSSQRTINRMRDALIEIQRHKS